MAERKMYERAYGDKYGNGEWMSAADIAKALRADIKQAIATGVIPGTAKDYKVVSKSFSGGQSVDLTLLNHTDLWVECDSDQADWCSQAYCPKAKWGEESHKVLSKEGTEVRKTLEWMLNRWNHDGSEIQVDYFDVRYYGQATIEDEGGRDFRLREAARKAEARKNAAAKKALVEHLVTEHGQRKGHLRNYTYESLAKAHADRYDGCGYESKGA